MGVNDMDDVKNYETIEATETFSYLPPMEFNQVQEQIEYLLYKDWTPMIEHVEPHDVLSHYWHMWKLPMFGEKDYNEVLAELLACHAQFPHDHIRLIGLNKFAQSQGMAFVVY